MANSLTGYSRQSRTGVDGTFAVEDVPQNSYIVRVRREGFQTWTQTVAVRTAVPIELKIQLSVASRQDTVMVEARPEVLVENTTVASHTVDQSTLAALPIFSPGSGLNDAIIFTTPNVAADSNGFFHPMGDHAQVSYIIDGQPISDQRNKVFSTSIPDNAIQSMELISGSPAAEYGDKTSLVVNANTRSGGRNRSWMALVRASALLIFMVFGCMPLWATRMRDSSVPRTAGWYLIRASQSGPTGRTTIRYISRT